MPFQLNSPGWKIRGVRASRGVARDGIVDLPGLPPEFLTDASGVAEEIILEPRSATRGREAGSDGLDLTYDLEPGQTAMLAIRHPSGALTFHLPVQSTSRGKRGPSRVRFQVAVRRNATRGVAPPLKLTPVSPKRRSTRRPSPRRPSAARVMKKKSD